MLPGATKAGTKSRSAVDKHRGAFLFFVAFGVRKGSDWFGRVRKSSDQISQEETEQTKGKATEMFSPPRPGSCKRDSVTNQCLRGFLRAGKRDGKRDSVTR